MKTYQYYEIYYQYIISELGYNDFYDKAHWKETNPDNSNAYNNYQYDFKQMIFYGR